MLKKNDLHESIRQPVVNRDESHDRQGRPDVKHDTRHELHHGPVGCRSSNARQLGCVFHDVKPPKSILRKSSGMRSDGLRRLGRIHIRQHGACDVDESQDVSGDSFQTPVKTASAVLRSKTFRIVTQSAIGRTGGVHSSVLAVSWHSL